MKIELTEVEVLKILLIQEQLKTVEEKISHLQTKIGLLQVSKKGLQSEGGRLLKEKNVPENADWMINTDTLTLEFEDPLKDPIP